jgi:hypothetical protein
LYTFIEIISAHSSTNVRLKRIVLSRKRLQFFGQICVKFGWPLDQLPQNWLEYK